jgi:ABC-type lipoprotein release transport system permease subunit
MRNLVLEGCGARSLRQILVLAALSIADVVYLNLPERAAEIATLKTICWGPSQIRATVLL